MLCPFCLSNQNTFAKTESPTGLRFLCPNCSESIPPRYIADYNSCPPLVVSIVGFRGHGKTVYCASLIYLLRRGGVGSVWPGFFTIALNEESLDIALANANMLEKGELPPSTVKNFPRPILLQVHGIPTYPPRTLLIYDTAGEVFERASHMIKYATFVSKAQSVLLLVSIRDLSNPGPELAKLLNTYLIGLEEMGGNPKNQNLIVVLTQADRWFPALKDFPEIQLHLVYGSVGHLTDTDNYIQKLQNISHQLKEFVRRSLRAEEFVYAAENFFKHTRFCAVSALGSSPIGHKLQTKILPKRVLDPIFWLVHDSLGPWEKLKRTLSRRNPRTRHTHNPEMEPVPKHRITS